MNALFLAVFAFFALSMLVIAFLAVRWGVRRDRAARRSAAGPASGDPGTPGLRSS